MCRFLVVFLLLPLRAICSPPLEWVNRQAAWCRVYLFHGCQDALRAEKACHLEAVGPVFEEPRLKRTVPLKELCKPGPQGARAVWCLEKKRKENVKTNTTAINTLQQHRFQLPCRIIKKGEKIHNYVRLIKFKTVKGEKVKCFKQNWIQNSAEKNGHI